MLIRSCCALALISGANATDAPPLGAQAPIEASTWRQDRIEVSSGAHAYELRILLPPEHDTTSTGLPVLYYLDAWWWGELFEGVMRLASAAHPPRIEPVILVGIATVGDADAWNRARNRDFTPSPYQPIAPGVTMRTGNVIIDSAGTGGAGAFLAFLEQTVVPTVERRYRVAKAGRGLAGHSYGGLFATWVLATKPELFDRFVLISPSTYWNDGEVLATGIFADTAARTRHRVFLATGGKEMPIMRQSGDDVAAALAGIAGTAVHHVTYAGADHLTVLPRALIDGVMHLYPR